MKFEILTEKIDGKKFRLIRPIEALTDDEYDDIKPWIENMGGHWRERVKAFTFAMDSAKRESFLEWQEQHQFFPTPSEVAKRVVELANLEHIAKSSLPVVLEPSAGAGALLDEIPIWFEHKEYVIEPVDENADILEDKGYKAERIRFEEFYNQHKNLGKDIDIVIMNPPFSKSRDIKHTLMAYDLLKDGGTLVSVVSENAMYYDNDASNQFRDWLDKTHAYIEHVPYGLFKESGTTIDTIIIKVTKA